MTIDAVLMGSAGTYTVSATVALESDFDNAGVNVVYILARRINNEYFCSVVGYENESFNLTSAGQSGSFQHTFNVDASWDSDDIQGYVLVQRFNTDDSEIYQAATAGTAAVTTEALNWGDAYIGSEFQKSFSVINISTTTTSVNLASTGSGFEVSGETTYTLAPGEMQEHIVTFAPTAAEDYTSTLTITTEIPMFENNVVEMTGTGFLDHAPVIENIAFEGYFMQHSAIEVTYDFEDEDNDDEGNSIYTWYQSTDGADWTVYNNINTNQFILNTTTEHVGYFYKFDLAPYDEHGMPGELVSIQTPIAIEALATPLNLDYEVQNGNDIVLNWEVPVFPTRAHFGYKVKRGVAFVGTITSPDVTTFTDVNVEDGTHEYSVVAIYSPGGLSNPSNLVTITLAGGVDNANDVIELSSITNGPNPFKTSTTLSFQTKREEKVQVGVYNIKGQLINRLYNASSPAGNHEVVWNGTDSNGKQCSAGVYFYRIITPQKTVSRKMILVK